jgi:hypothetical protein
MHLVIPFASALSEAAAHALGTLQLPNLERVLGRWAAAAEGAAAPDEADEYSLSPPHERVLAALRGWPVADGLLPFAAAAARDAGLAVDAGSGWGLLTPTHWHVGRDQVSLADPAGLDLGEDEARTLHGALEPLFEDIGWHLHWRGPTRWFVDHPSLAALPTASIDRVIGRNVDLWLHEHPGLRLVRRLQSEAQMLLYVHPLNEAREARGLQPVNSFWLSGTGTAPAAEAVLPADVVVDERLRAPALAEDWTTWAEAWAALDAGPLRALAQAGEGGPARLTLCGERAARTWTPAATPWWKRLLGARPPALSTVLASL